MNKLSAEQIKSLCEDYAQKKYGDKLQKWIKENEEIWYLPVLEDYTEEKTLLIKTSIKKLAIFKMIDRHIMAMCNDKMSKGFYVYIESIMRECLLNDDDEGNYILTNERAFLGAAPQFNTMIESVNTAFVKR